MRAKRWFTLIGCGFGLLVLSAAPGLAEEVGHYSFDEGSGTTIHDSSPSANHGSLSSSSLWSSPGYDGTGHCIQLPGYSGTQYASIPHNSLQNFDGMIFLSAWVNPQPSGQSINPVLVKGSSGVPYGLDIYDGKLYFQGNYQTGGVEFAAWSTGTVPYGQWSQVGVAYDQKNVTFYINGQRSGQTPMTVPIVNNSQPMYVGIDFPGFNEKYKGKIDEVVINNTAGVTPPPKPVIPDPLPPMPDPEPGQNRLVMITHGRNGVAGGWQKEIADSIRQELPASWNVESRKWIEESKGWPVAVAERAKLLGWYYGQGIAPKEYEHVHFIAHSAGSWYIEAAAAAIRKYDAEHGTQTTIHLTFLDAYVPYGEINADKLGVHADWSDNYYVGDWTDLFQRLTSQDLLNAHNVSLHAIDEQAEAVHDYPHEWYDLSVTGREYERGFDEYGFVRSLEAGGWPDSIDPERFPLGNNGRTVTVTKNGDRSWQASVVSQSDTGTVTVDENGLGLGTESPVWATMLLELGEDDNYVQFEYQFNGVGEGFLSVHLNDALILLGDERVDDGDLCDSGILYIGDLLEDWNWLSFRLDPLGEDPAGVWISDIEYGHVTPEPATLALLVLGGMALLVRRRK